MVAADDNSFTSRSQQRNAHKYKVLTRQSRTVEELCQEYYEQLAVRQRQKTDRLLTAERVLDAPNIVDDFYLNVMDWGVRGELGIALGSAVYLWRCEDGSVRELTSFDSDGQSTTVTSLGFIHDGTFVGLGLGNGQLQIWDANTGSRIRTLMPHESSRIAALSWNKHVLSVGSTFGGVASVDVRAPPTQAILWRSRVSDGEICGLKWSWDGTCLAAGTNDNIVSVMAGDGGRQQYRFHHRSAVKALAWSPWQAGILASGGGAADRTVQMHDLSTCQPLSHLSYDCHSQVSGIVWSRSSKEFVTVHGFADNAIKVWSSSSAADDHPKCAIIGAHDQRILHSALSPCGQVLCTAGADECIKFWRIFGKADEGESESGDAKRVLLPKLLPTFAKNKRTNYSAVADNKKKNALFFKKP